MANRQPYLPQITVMLEEAMDEEGLTLKELAAELSIVDEYARRLVNGDRGAYNIPGTQLLKNMCIRFGWDFEKTEQIAEEDRVAKKYGAKAVFGRHVDPEAQPIERRWHLLEQAQKDLIMSQFETFITQNKRKVRSMAVRKAGSSDKKIPQRVS